jgi:hypothetical protein
MDATQTTTHRTKAVSLADEDAVKNVLVESVLGLWDVVNNLTRLQPSKREHYRVTIFGSARAKPGTVAYEETKRAAKALAELGCDIITGGGPGLMQAANEGVEAGGNSASMGIRGRSAVRAGSKSFRSTCIRTPHLLHAVASLRSCVGCVHRRARRHWHGAGNDDDLAVASG